MQHQLEVTSLERPKCLEIHYPSASGRPSVSVWLDALDEMPQLRMLSLLAASPVALPARLPSGIRRTITLASLSVLDLSASARDCVLALAHLIIPALTQLRLTVLSTLHDGSDVQELLPYVSQHIKGFQNNIQSMIVHRGGGIGTSMLAWDGVNLPKQIQILDEIPSASLGFSFRDQNWSSATHAAAFDAAMASLPSENLLSLTVLNCMNHFSKQVWLHHAQMWSLLQRVCLSPSAVCGFMEMLLEDDGRLENPRLPSLTTLVLIAAQLSVRRALRLRHVLMKRVEQGVPLARLDLHSCTVTNRAVELLSEIAVDFKFLGPKETFEERERTTSIWDHVGRSLVVQDDSSGEESQNDSHTDSDCEIEFDSGDASAAYWQMLVPTYAYLKSNAPP